VTTEALVAVIVLLVGSHYASLIYRLHKAEEDLKDMRKELSQASISAAVAAANAIATTLKNKG